MRRAMDQQIYLKSCWRQEREAIKTTRVNESRWVYNIHQNNSIIMQKDDSFNYIILVELDGDKLAKEPGNSDQPHSV